MIIKGHMFVYKYFIAQQLLQKVIKSPKYDENHIRCFLEHQYEILKLIIRKLLKSYLIIGLILVLSKLPILNT